MQEVEGMEANSEGRTDNLLPGEVFWHSMYRNLGGEY
jgi:hypothetical protein